MKFSLFHCLIGVGVLAGLGCNAEPSTSEPGHLGVGGAASSPVGGAGASGSGVGRGASGSTSEGGSAALPFEGAGGAGASGAPGQTALGGRGGDAGQATPQAAFAYVGSSSNQIYVYSMDQETGALTLQGNPVAANPNPSFLAFAPDGKYLYAVNEADDVDSFGAGAVSAFRVDPATGSLSFINRVSSQGAGPAHVATDHTGKFVFVANYNGGTIAVLPVGDNGTLGSAVDSAAHGAGAQAHEVVIDPSNRFLFTPNKGLSNISQYEFDATTGQITPNTPAAVALPVGAGSRHLAFHPTAPYAYLINELNDTVVALSFAAAQGTLTPIQTLSTLPPGANAGANSCAEIQVAPSGNFVYGSNRGDNSIVIYAVNPANGMLSLVGHQATGGNTPRSFHLDRGGKIMLVANQGSNEVVTFQVDPSSGLLTEKGSVSVQGPAFVGVLYLPLP
jgi:6-phosphogluconolactonase